MDKYHSGTVQVLKAKELSEHCPVSAEKVHDQACSASPATLTATVLSSTVGPARLRVCLIRKPRERLHCSEVKGVTENHEG